MKRVPLLVTILVLTAWGVQSMAATLPDEEETSPRPPKFMQRMDPDGDGQITFDEYRRAWEQRMQQRFERLDRDGDGVLRAPEIEQMRERLARMRGRLEERRREPLPQ